MESSCDLFLAIEKGAIATAAKDWAAAYREDGSRAMCDLLQFLLSACGSEGNVTIDDIQDSDQLNVLMDSRMRLLKVIQTHKRLNLKRIH
jgi:hypothetical protein